MKIEIIPIKEEEKLILSHLLELYEYDFTDFQDNDVNPLGLYGYSYLDYYWTEKQRFPYFVKVDGALAGFVLINNYCYVSKDQDRLFVSEFFIMKKYRRKGIGTTVATEVLKKHPGKWELTIHMNNPKALIFWDKVIKNLSCQYQIFENLENIYDNNLAKAYLFDVKED